MAISPRVQWTTATTAWQQLDMQDQHDRMTFRQPMILRFATDTFMEDFFRIVNFAPNRLSEWEATPETWREPAPDPKLPFEVPLALRAQYDQSQGDDLNDIVPDGKPLKLFQAAHQRFYMITASLVCRIPGLPDRTLDVSDGERVTFVVRRLFPNNIDADVSVNPPQQFTECAYVNGQWLEVDTVPVSEFADSPGQILIPGEEQIPLSPVPYIEPGEYRRRLLAGLIPVGNHQNYMDAPRVQYREDAAGGATLDYSNALPANHPLNQSTDIAQDSREALFRQDVLDPMAENINAVKNTIRGALNNLSARNLKSVDDDDKSDVFNEIVKNLKNARNGHQTSSWYLLLDFARFLKDYINPVWQSMDSACTSIGNDPCANFSTKTTTDLANAGLNTNEINLYLALQGTRVNFGGVNSLNLNPSATSATWKGEIETYLRGDSTPSNTDKSLLEILVQVEGASNALENSLDPAFDDAIPTILDNFLISAHEIHELFDPYNYELLTNPAAIRDPNAVTLAKLVYAALDGQPLTRRMPAMPIAAQIALDHINTNASDKVEGWFTVRCVFERPNCMPYQMPVVSDKTDLFQMASFFDPDAPARAISIPLPVDTSPAGLRKFAKNTGFRVSDVLCGQINKMRRKITFVDLVLSVLPWPFHQDLPGADAALEPCSEQSGGNTFGMICSLSIPIVTICAFIILIIFVLLLDIIFKWVPYLILCFPILQPDSEGG